MIAGTGPRGFVAQRLDEIARRASDPARQAGCEVEPEGSRARVRLWGSLPFAWCGNLSLHCYAADLSIVELDARLLEGGRWVASLLLESSQPDKEPPVCDFLWMARRRPVLVPLRSRIEIECFDLARREDGRVARLQLGARDRLGLLAGIVGRVLTHELRPRELCVRTNEGRAEDWMLLEGRDGRAPSPDALDSLERSFREALGDRSAPPPSQARR